MVITIEWRHLEIDGATCNRCATTGDAIQKLIQELESECATHEVHIQFTETRLDAADIGQSNLILINGLPLEEILPQTEVSTSPCCSCGDLIGAPTSCRTLIHGGEVYEAIPNRLIRDAICTVAGCCPQATLHE